MHNKCLIDKEEMALFRICNVAKEEDEENGCNITSLNSSNKLAYLKQEIGKMKVCDITQIMNTMFQKKFVITQIH